MNNVKTELVSYEEDVQKRLGELKKEIKVDFTQLDISRISDKNLPQVNNNEEEEITKDKGKNSIYIQIIQKILINRMLLIILKSRIILMILKIRINQILLINLMAQKNHKNRVSQKNRKNQKILKNHRNQVNLIIL